MNTNDWKPNEYETLRQVLDREADNFRHGSYNKPQFVEKLVTLFDSYKQELAGKIEQMEITEGDGWEILVHCCPGDDIANGYNKALTDIINFLNQ